MKPVMRHLNSFNRIINSSKPTITKAKVQQAHDEIIQFNDQWNIVKQKNDAFEQYTLGNKQHYVLDHMVGWMDVWNTPIGRNNEQSVECVQKVSNDVLPRYNNFKGVLRTKYFMEHLMLLTSPEYQ